MVCNSLHGKKVSFRVSIKEIKIQNWHLCTLSLNSQVQWSWQRKLWWKPFTSSRACITVSNPGSHHPFVIILCHANTENIYILLLEYKGRSITFKQVMRMSMALMTRNISNKIPVYLSGCYLLTYHKLQALSIQWSSIWCKMQRFSTAFRERSVTDINNKRDAQML